MAGTLDFEFRFSRAGRNATRTPETPMHILVLGDFSGRTGSESPPGSPDIARRGIQAVDIDNFERVMEKLQPRIKTNFASSSMEVSFGEMDDFHPDSLYRRLPLFDALRNTRARLSDPATFHDVAAQLLGASAPEPGVPAEPADSSAEGLFDQLLGRPPQSPAVQRAVASGVNEIIRQIVAPHIVPDIEPTQRPLIQGVDDAIAEQMRALLHAPEFQRLEALWRSLHRLVSELVSDEELKIFILDLTRDELHADLLGSGDNLEVTQLYGLLVDRNRSTPGAAPWSLLVSDLTFGPGEEDLTLLAALGAIGSQAGAPLVAAAAPEFVGCAGFADQPDPADWLTPNAQTQQRWQTLRRADVARWIGLALPRVLGRLPYGRATEPVESFHFEELPFGPQHRQLLWASPAFPCAELLTSGFLESGWSMEPGDHLDLADLPTYTYEINGETAMYPCAEAFLGEHAMERLLSAGLMALLSHKRSGAVRLARFQSIAEPAAPLAGPWE